MVNQWLNSSAVSQCDALGVFNAIRSILEAPSLAQAGAQRFRMPKADVDDSALSVLLRHRLVHELTDFDTRIENFLIMDGRNVSASEELKDIERKLKTMDVRRRHAEDDAQRNRILKTKTERWEDANRRQSLGKAHDELLARRHEIRMNQKEAGDVFEGLRHEVEHEASLRHGRWVAPTALGLTRSVVFLFEELSELNSEHFVGRSLADVLAIGPLLG